VDENRNFRRAQPRVLGGVTGIRWDEIFGEIEVSPEGPVFPSDLEILGRGEAMS